MQQEPFQPDIDQGTKLDSIDEIRDYLAAHYTPTMQESKDAQAAKADACQAMPFRPVNRPPMALLIVMDDGVKSGEIIRIRGSSFRIGREVGDLVIPHDNAISTVHAELRRAHVDGEYRWYFRDLDSTNGVFARVGSGLLKPKTQIMLGRTRLEFHPAEQASQDEASGKSGSTQPWAKVDDPQSKLYPSLRTLANNENKLSFPFNKPILIVGSDSDQCDIVVPDDPFVSSVHATIEQDKQRQWYIRPAKCRNGVWVKIRTVRVHTGGVFLVGEQKFTVKVM